MERRAGRRAPCRTPVRVCHRDTDAESDVDGSVDGALVDWFFLDSTDVGAEGVFLQTDLLFPVGERLDLELDVPGRSRAVRGRGEVVRVVADVPHSGVAIRLSGLTDEERRALSRMSCELVRRGPGKAAALPANDAGGS